MLGFGGQKQLTHTGPFRAVSRSKAIRRPTALGVETDRFDHEVEFVGAVDLARYAVGHIGPDEQGFRKVMEPINALRVEVPQQEHCTDGYSVREAGRGDWR